jgi:hypothetical protein
MSSAKSGRMVYCVITDLWGEKVKTNTVYLRMAATITQQPETVTVKKGDTAEVSVKAIGDSLKYAWYAAAPGSTIFTKSTTFTGTTYSAEMDEDRDGRKVYCVVTDKWGKKAKSNIVTLNLHKPPKITTQPKTTYTKNGGTASVSVKATGVGLKYAWYVKSAGSTAFKKSSVTKSTYSVKMTSSVKDRQVYCVITDKLGSKVKTNVVYLRMAASITAQPKHASAKSGATVKTTVKAVGRLLKYQALLIPAVSILKNATRSGCVTESMQILNMTLKESLSAHRTESTKYER